MFAHPELGDFKIIKMLGTGGFSTVYLAESVQYHFQVAIKELTKEGNGNKETRIIQKANSPFIVEVYDMFECNGRQCILMEYIDGENLITYIKKKSFLSEIEAKEIFRQIALGIMHLHSKGIVHRDIKCENILIDKGFGVHVIDFGFASDTNTMMDTYCGSPLYVAPELITRKKYTQSVDIWSMGIILYIMVTGIVPFNGDNIQQLFKNIMQTKPAFTPFMSRDLINLLEGMLRKDENIRFQMDDIMSHPWLKDTFDETATRRSSLPVLRSSHSCSPGSFFNPPCMNEKRSDDLAGRILRSQSRQKTFNDEEFSALIINPTQSMTDVKASHKIGLDNPAIPLRILRKKKVVRRAMTVASKLYTNFPSVVNK